MGRRNRPRGLCSRRAANAHRCAAAILPHRVEVMIRRRARFSREVLLRHSHDQRRRCDRSHFVPQDGTIGVTGKGAWRLLGPRPDRPCPDASETFGHPPHAGKIPEALPVYKLSAGEAERQIYFCDSSVLDDCCVNYTTYGAPTQIYFRLSARNGSTT